jgi:hypothetical protein
VRQAICGNLPQSAKKNGGVARQRRAAAMRDMPLIICANLRNLRIKNVCYQSVTAYDRPIEYLGMNLKNWLMAARVLLLPACDASYCPITAQSFSQEQPLCQET